MRVRWWVCLLLFVTWVMSYVDRSLMPMAIPFIAREFHISPSVMGVVLSAFFVGYASMQIPGGLIADKLGPRKTVTIGIMAWSVFSLLTGIARNLTQLIWIRIGFGVCEGVHPPATVKMLAAWFPAAERTRASAWMFSSNTIGPMLTPILFASAMAALGWRGAFLAISIPGFLIAIVSYWFLRDHPAKHPKVTASELAESRPESQSPGRISVREVVKYKGLWQLFFIYMAWDTTWWGFQAWLPSYLFDRGFTLVKTGMAAALPYAAGFAGMLISAHVSDRLRNRRAVLITVLLGNAICMLLTSRAPSNALAVFFLTATGFFLPAIHGPFWSLPMDLLPSHVIGASAGFINTAGQIAGLASPVIIGALVQSTGAYEWAFVFMALSAAVSAFLVMTLQEQPKATAQPVEVHG